MCEGWTSPSPGVQTAVVLPNDFFVLQVRLGQISRAEFAMDDRGEITFDRAGDAPVSGRTHPANRGKVRPLPDKALRAQPTSPPDVSSSSLGLGR